MSFKICIKRRNLCNNSPQEVRNLFSLPPFKQSSFSGEPYCQFEVLGLLILIHRADEEDRDPEVMHYPYCFDLQMSFCRSRLDTDSVEYRLQPYYAQLLSFQLGLDTAFTKKQKVNRACRYATASVQKILNGTQPFCMESLGGSQRCSKAPPSPWRSMHPVF